MPINVASATETVYTKDEVDALGIGGLRSVVPGNNIDVDNTDPVNPTLSVESLTSVDITDFVEAAQDAVAAMLSQGSGVTLSYDDTANTLTITGTTSSGLDAEAVRDAIGVALVGVGVVSVVVNDAADTIAISSIATQNATDAALRDRATHTGAQAISTVTGLQAQLDCAPRILLWTGTAWPDRPNDTKPTIFVGGTTAPTDTDLKDGDLWVS